MRSHHDGSADSAGGRSLSPATRHRQAPRFHDATDRDAIRATFLVANADLDDAMFAVDAGRRGPRGFFAFRRIAWESPLTWPLLAVFYLPGAGIIGPRVYAWLPAAQRLGCASDVCEVPIRRATLTCSTPLSKSVVGPEPQSLRLRRGDAATLGR
jgi:hypothetical protein